MRMNLYVATCSLLAYTGLAFSQIEADHELAQNFDYDYDYDLAETYKCAKETCKGDGKAKVAAVKAKLAA